MERLKKESPPDYIRITTEVAPQQLAERVVQHLLEFDQDIFYIVLEKPELVEGGSLQLFKHGFCPFYVVGRKKFKLEELQLFQLSLIENMSEEEIKFWFNPYYTNKDLTDKTHWAYANIDYLKRIAAKTGESDQLLFFAPDQLYPSKRPKTDMAVFRTASSNVIEPGNIFKHSDYSYTLLLGQDLHNALPVTRYAQGMSKGLYFGENKDYCGTFYYYEPLSTTYLIYKEALIFKNKHEAYKSLYQMGIEHNILFEPEDNLEDEIDERMHHSIAAFAEDYYGIKKHGFDYPEDLMLTPLQYYAIAKNAIRHGHDIVQDLPERRYYVGQLFGLYALEDIYDQAICLTASSLGIDILIFTHMVGSHQIVSEVLDTRKRMESLKNLVYVV